MTSFRLFVVNLHYFHTVSSFCFPIRETMKPMTRTAAKQVMPLPWRMPFPSRLISVLESHGKISLRTGSSYLILKTEVVHFFCFVIEMAHDKTCLDKTDSISQAFGLLVPNVWGRLLSNPLLFPSIYSCQGNRKKLSFGYVTQRWMESWPLASLVGMRGDGVCDGGVCDGVCDMGCV